MDQHISDFFSEFSDEKPRGNFHRVIALHDAPDVEWEDVNKKVPTLSRGWYELTHISSKDRIEFMRDYWLAKLPFTPRAIPGIETFFSELDDIGVYITEKRWDDPWEVTLVYSLKKNRGFYRGALPANDEEIVELQMAFSDRIIPQDFLAFAKIHNGFCKATDSTGVLPLKEIFPSFNRLQQHLDGREPLYSKRKQLVEPKSLLPFYESFGMPCFQCFWSQWYPENEMGNVWYSGLVHEMTSSEEEGPSPENMAFPTFLDWLVFYLEKVV